MSANPPKFTVNGLFRKLITNEQYTLSREALVKMLGLDPDGRNLNTECGYPEGEPPLSMYRELYDREGLAARVVNVYPDECWAVHPTLYEVEDKKITPFEKAWSKVLKKTTPWHYLHRVDKLSGIGEFGVLFLGFNDPNNTDLSRPVPGIRSDGSRDPNYKPKKPHELSYIRAFPQDFVSVASYEEDPRNPRCGMPTSYEIQISDPSIPMSGELAVEPGTIRRETVHWTRILHVADNREASETHGKPRMKLVLNRLLDIRKILGSSGEMFYKGAFPGYSFEEFPNAVEEGTLDADSVRAQFLAYQNGLQRYLALTGMTVKQLNPQMGDPTNHVLQQLMAICAAIGVPLRIFMGSEAGHLASTQDKGTWNGRVSGRQQLYVDPFIVRPFVDRLIAAGVLPEVDDYTVAWNDLNTMTDEEKANVGLKKAQSLMQYTTGGCETVIPVREFLTICMNLSDEQADSVIASLGKAEKRTTDVWKKPTPTTKPQGGGRTGSKPPRKSAGRPAGKVQKN